MVAPFQQTITTVTGPTRDAATLAEAVTAIRPAGGTAIMDGAVGGGPAGSATAPSAAPSC